MKRPNPLRITITLRHLLILLSLNAIILIAVSWPALNGRLRPAPTQTSLPSLTQQPTATSTLTETPSLSPSPTEPSVTQPLALDLPNPLAQGLMVLSIQEGGYAHLFAYQPASTPLTRLTNHPWDDIDPSLSPDGQMVAYSSRQNGYWDLFLLNLATGKTTRLTDSAEYKGAPSWSPDSQWLVYEDYEANRLGLVIRSVSDPGQPPIPLNTDQGSNYSPAWSPQGRLVAFVSDQTGIPEIWMADLNKTDQTRFTKISQDPLSRASHPAWSPDGNRLAWAATANGYSTLYVWDRLHPDAPPQRIGSGDWPVWSPSGDMLATRIQQPNQVYLTIYQVPSGNVVLAPLALPAQLMGFDWKKAVLPSPLPAAIANSQAITPTAIWASPAPTLTDVPAGRHNLAELKDVTAPHPYLLDSITPAFTALRQRLANEIGWDYLASLENAFTPITDTLAPDGVGDWLYTGRAIAVNSVPVNADWMVIVREDFGAETYWRIYLKTRYQDGSQGEPIHQVAWDLNARYSGDPQVYDQGGSYTSAPPTGYWVDFTSLAQAYGWERVPALIDWRTYYPAIRFNQFVIRGGLDWRSALEELYPAQILMTATPVLAPTRTPTATPYWFRPRTSTPTPTVTVTATRRPTWTPESP